MILVFLNALAFTVVRQSQRTIYQVHICRQMLIFAERSRIMDYGDMSVGVYRCV